MQVSWVARSSLCSACVGSSRPVGGGRMRKRAIVKRPSPSDADRLPAVLLGVQVEEHDAKRPVQEPWELCRPKRSRMRSRDWATMIAAVS